MAQAAAPTRETDAVLRERALDPVVSNLVIAPFWLVPFTVLVSLVNDLDAAAETITTVKAAIDYIEANKA